MSMDRHSRNDPPPESAAGPSEPPHNTPWPLDSDSAAGEPASSLPPLPRSWSPDPSGAASEAAGDDFSAEQVSTLPPPPSSPPGFERRGRGLAGRRPLGTAVVAGLLVAVLLVGFGYRLAGIGEGDSPTAAGDGASSKVAPQKPAGLVVDDDSGQVVPAAENLLSDAGVIEPVVAVAQTLAPSVVRIQVGEGLGSGIVWDADEGYIITNNHVVSSVDSVEVWFEDGLRVNGIVVGGDSARDVAVVRVESADIDLVPATFAGIETVDVGQLAVAVGHPFGLEQSVTAGVVSVVDWVNTDGGSESRTNPVPVRMIQTDAPINPGNSGGALADRFGRVIGMNTSIYTSGLSFDNAGVGFAVPSETVLVIAERIVNGESLELGYLGVHGESLTDGTSGAVVTWVVDGSPADRGGIMVDDLIVAVNGRDVMSMEGLAADVKLYRPGETMEIEVLRAGSRVVLRVEAGLFQQP